ncbi:MAG: enoyl-[acyl-carrier protein] reductase, partial [Eubacteriaceae bacterium]|nr:enoyl-[acyl-carrier protein] reductase [Eubacteriaceae bacterium]MDK2961297.1 enoyl-[acyl-carrier protein] reductase [Eubacteriaceae bacterium]
KGCFMAGQIAGMVTKRETVAQIIDSLVTETEQSLKGGLQWVK